MRDPVLVKRDQTCLSSMCNFSPALLFLSLSHLLAGTGGAAAAAVSDAAQNILVTTRRDAMLITS